MFGWTARPCVVLLVLMLAGPSLSVVPARADISLELDVLQTFQSVESEFGGTDNDESSGFGATRANLHVFGEIDQHFDAYVEFHLNPPQLAGRRSDVRMNEAYIVWFRDTLSLKAGQIELDYGNQHWYRTDNAQSRDNWFVANGLVDPVAVQRGLEATGSVLNEPIAWSVGFTNGTGGGGGTFDAEREFAVSAKLWGNVTRNLMLGGSYYKVDQSRTTATSNLFGDTTFEVIQGINPGTVAPPVSLGKRMITDGALGAGNDVTAGQLDLDYTMPAYIGVVRAWWGRLEDDDTNGPVAGQPTTESDYWGLEVRTDPLSELYAAARWHRLEPDLVAGTPVDGKPEQVSVVVGSRISEHAMIKVEWLRMDRDGLGGIDAGLRGWLVEGSATF